ncbi:MAG TPA: YCF48-related protein [Pirellulaceae bacterium]|jgi:photosystem II stability/assembly factor-like uncharacterized protein|nr:YCF48-related protein [Pirellulaceae bacterium]
MNRLAFPDAERSRSSGLASLFVATLACLCAGEANAIDVESAGLRQDATLRDVTFLNMEDGWAVGDAGTVLRTTDGGATWTEARIDSTAMLTGVAFADRERGLIVGWKLSPYTHRASAEVLSTADGGETWIRQTNESRNPTAQAARLQPGFLGLAVGEEELTAYGYVNLHARTGLAPWSGPTMGFRREGIDRRAPITAATRADAGTWLFVDASGAVSRVRDGALEPVRFADANPPVVKALSHDGPIVAAAGADAFAAVSTDSGVTFQVVRPLPAELSRIVHWKSVAIRGTSIWLAGSPGSIVAESGDAGATWKLHTNVDPLPIERIFFLDRSRGWAAGAFGTIRRTLDGGKTWTVTRGAGRAAGLATFSAAPHDAPLEPLAKHATVDGYRAVNWTLADVDDEGAWSGPTAGTRLAFASAECGGGSVENLTGRVLPVGALEDMSAVLAKMAREGVSSEEAAVSRLAAWIRTWRPEVALIPAPPSLGGSPADEQAHRFALAALDRAADPRFEYSAMRTLGLDPWQPKRVASPTSSPDVPLRTDGADYVAASRLSLAEYALVLRSYLETAPALNWKDAIRYAEIRRNLPRGGANELFADIHTSAGTARRRERTPPDATRLREHTDALPWRRSFETLAHPETQGESFVARFEDAVRRTANFDPSSASAALHSCACLASARGRDDLAEVAWTKLVERDPQGSLAEYAALRLATAAGSKELRAVQQRVAEARAEAKTLASNSLLPGVQSFALPKPASDPNGGSVRHDDLEYRAVEIEPGAVAFGPVPKAVAEQLNEVEVGIAPAGDAGNPIVRLDQLNGAAPWTLAWPRPQFAAWAIGQSQGGAVVRGTSPSQLIATLPPSLAALIDGTLAGSSASLVQIVRMREKPYLDGRWSEAAWTEAALADRRDGERLAIGFDDDYLFLLYEAPKIAFAQSNAGQMQTALGAMRKVPAASLRRDASLLGAERLAVIVDVDGDALTSMRFEVDRFGRCRETMFGDASFSPTWHAATTTDGNSWGVEVAIPRTSDWAGKRQAPIVSALGVYRIVPGEGTFDVLTGQRADDPNLPVRRTLWLDGGPMGVAASATEAPTEASAVEAPIDARPVEAAASPGRSSLPGASLQFDAAPNASPRPTRLPGMR